MFVSDNVIYIKTKFVYLWWAGNVCLSKVGWSNGGINRHTAHTHTCVRRQRSGGPRADSFWRAKRASRRQTFGERSEFWEKKFDERSEPLADKLFGSVFFFVSKLWGNSSSEMSKIPPRLEGGGGWKTIPTPPSPDWGGGCGIFPCSVKKQSEMPKNFVCNSDIIPKNISPCGAMLKRITHRIYII